MLKVKVYFNITKKTFSIQHNGKVIGHADQIALKNVEFKVSEKGRQRVLKEKRKNVHAYVVGEISDFQLIKVQGVGVTYNPYKFPNFYERASGQSVFATACAKLTVEDKKARITV